MNLLSLTHFTMFLICIWLIYFTLSKNPTATPNKVSALLICSYAIWNFAYMFFHAALSKNHAMLWFNIASFGFCSFPSIGVWFSLVFGKKEGLLKKWYLYFLIFLVSAVFIYHQWTGDLVDDYVKQFYGWEVVWSTSIWPWLYYAYYISFMTFSFRIWYQIGKKARFSYEKKQAKIIFYSGLLIFLMGTVTDVLCPQFKVYGIPPLGPILIIIWTIGMVYAITKYKLMVLTPAYAASDILSTMSDSLVLIDPEGKIIEVNAATIKMLGYTREEIVGKPADILFSEELSLFMRTKLERLLREVSRDEYRAVYRTKNGVDVPIDFSSAVMQDQDGNYIGVVGIARDLRGVLILQEKEREFLVEKARTEALQERAQDLQDAYDKLKTTQTILLQSEKMAAVGQLAGGVAHEINNPIGVILGFAQGIVRRIEDDDPLYLPLKSIEREAIRCKKLAGDLLTFSRSGKTQAEMIDINTTIDETLTLIATRTKVKNIEIIKEYGTAHPHFTANKNQIQQVILNLCNNAIDAMPDGGCLTIRTKNNEKQIEINISDTGPGITDEVKKHIFEPFFTTKEVGKGTGLGLSLCYEIIRKHQGVIEVESETGNGSTFRIKLPIT
ncbi:MAG TPA: ATP-binding protein [Bacillota bacterium]|nr:ATP-binding protein [Bacillota bacterium]